MSEGESQPNECTVKVFCRFRPLNNAECKAGSKFVPKFPLKTEDCVNVGGKVFAFDRVFQPDVSQEKVYAESAYPIVKDVLNGYNGTVFAYGQTSSGKTHTMEGIIGDAKHQGIIPRIVSDIFNHIYSLEEDLQFHIKVSYFEIYMDRIRDLLDVTKTNLAVHEDKNRMPYVKNCTERFVSCPEEVMDAIEEGKYNRHVAVTNMNEHSSRSHSVFLISVKQDNEAAQKMLSGKLYLVDLAGSEKVSKTGAEGTVLDEAKNINKSLSALGNVISALSENTKSHVPYRDSKLTRILQESLGGNARTTIVICCSPASYNETETKTTLQFGQRAKTIKNVVVVNQELSAEEWKRRYERENVKVVALREQIERIQAELDRLRRGESVAPNSDLVSGRAPPDPQTTPLSAASFTSPKFPCVPGLSDNERRKYEQDRVDLYRQLDEKDDEIQHETRIADQLRQQMLEQDEIIKAAQMDYEALQQEMLRISQESDTSKEEVKEVLVALEELAVNYDQKAIEANARAQENDKLNEDLDQKLDSLKSVTAELQDIRDSRTIQWRRAQEGLSNILNDLLEVGSVLGGNLADLKLTTTSNGRHESLDEEFTMARIYISKMKCEIKNMMQKTFQLEALKRDCALKISDNERELVNSRLLIQQHEARIRSLVESMTELEKKNRILEDAVDSVNEECSKLKAQEKATLCSSKPQDDFNQQLKAALESQLEQSREIHSKQIAQLRDEIMSKSRTVNDLQHKLEKVRVANCQLKDDYERLKLDDSMKEKKLREVNSLSDKREQARQDLKGLEETVSKELQTLHSLRKLFVADLQSRVKLSSVTEETVHTPSSSPDEVFVSSAAHKQKITFLESNLDQLTKVHKQLVRDNADLRCELPKLETRLSATAERIRCLESSLKDAKDSAIKSRKKYQTDIDRIKDAVRERNLAARNTGGGTPKPKIVKPIYAGHQPSSSPRPGRFQQPASTSNIPQNVQPSA